MSTIEVFHRATGVDLIVLLRPGSQIYFQITSFDYSLVVSGRLLRKSQMLLDFWGFCQKTRFIERIGLIEPLVVRFRLIWGLSGLLFPELHGGHVFKPRSRFTVGIVMHYLLVIRSLYYCVM